MREREVPLLLGEPTLLAPLIGHRHAILISDTQILDPVRSFSSIFDMSPRQGIFLSHLFDSGIILLFFLFVFLVVGVFFFKRVA